MGSELVNVFILKLRRTDSSLFVGGERFLRKIFKWMKLFILEENWLYILLELSVLTIL